MCQTLLHRALEIVRREIGRLHFGRHHDVSAFDTRGAHALPDRRLVAVHLRGIDMAVTNAERLLGAASGITQRPSAEANNRDLEPFGFDGRYHFLFAESSAKPRKYKACKPVARL